MNVLVGSGICDLLCVYFCARDENKTCWTNQTNANNPIVNNFSIKTNGITTTFKWVYERDDETTQNASDYDKSQRQTAELVRVLHNAGVLFIFFHTLERSLRYSIEQ